MGFGHIEKWVVHVIVFDTPMPRHVGELATADIVFHVSPPSPTRGCSLVQNIRPVHPAIRWAAICCKSRAWIREVAPVEKREIVRKAFVSDAG